jgi:hypothetical protein
VLVAFEAMKKDAKEAAPIVAAILVNPESSDDEANKASSILKGLGPEARGVASILEKAPPQKTKLRQYMIDEALKAINKR